MEHARQGSPLEVKPSDLDPEGRPWPALINVIVNGALVQVYCVDICLHSTPVQVQ